MVSGEPWAIYVGKSVSIAHDALVHGPCYIGDETFVGFKAVVHGSIVGAHCFVGIGSVVVGVEIPDGRFVPHGRIVETADAFDALPPRQRSAQRAPEACASAAVFMEKLKERAPGARLAEAGEQAELFEIRIAHSIAEGAPRFEGNSHALPLERDARHADLQRDALR